MAEVVKEHREPYVSCIRSFGRPILPPLMTDEKRQLMGHFRALACDREAARDKRKKEVLLHTLCKAELGSPPHSDECESLDESQLSSLSLGGRSPSLPLLGTRLDEGASNKTPDTGSSITLVPNSPDCKEGDDDGDCSSSFTTLASEVAQDDKAALSGEKDLVATVDAKKAPLKMSMVTPVATLMKMPMEAPMVTPVSSPVEDGCFSTKLSVPSLCRSRSFVVERPSLALLLWKEQLRDGHNNLGDVDVKIVVEPQKSPNRALFQQSPESSEVPVARVEEQADIMQSLKASETFVQKCGMSQVDDSGGQTAHTKTLHKLNFERVQTGFYPGLYSSKEPLSVPADAPFSEWLNETDEAPSLQTKWGSASPHFLSRVFSDEISGPVQIRNILSVPVNSSPKRITWDGLSSLVAWNPLEGITKNPPLTKDSAVDNTLNDAPNVPKEDDSTEEITADVFAAAFDDRGEKFAAAPPPSFVPKGKTFVTAWDSPKLAKTFVNRLDPGDNLFVPVSTTSNLRSLCFSNGSSRSSISAEDFMALNSSSDAEDEQYEDVQEPCDQHAGTSEHGDDVESAEYNDLSASSCGQQLKLMHLEQRLLADDNDHQTEVPYHAQACDPSIGHQGALETPPVSPAAVAEVVDTADGPESDDPALEPWRACSMSPTSVRGGSAARPVCLSADFSLLSCMDASQSQADMSSLASVSVHLDLLSETRQSLHPKWRRCFDRLTAMARGHLTRLLIKTHRVQSIIQTIKDTLECALCLHGEPHISSGLVTQQDVELHQRLIMQLTSACYELHDVFFNIPIAARMQLIAQMRTYRTRPLVSNTKSSTDRGARKISSATQRVLERRISRLAGQDPQEQTRRPTAVIRAQTYASGPPETCHTAGATAPSGVIRKICRLPLYKV